MGVASFYENIQELRDQLCYSFNNAVPELRVSDTATIEKIVDRIVEQAFGPYMDLLDVLTEPNADIGKQLVLAENQNQELLRGKRELTIENRHLNAALLEASRKIQELESQNQSQSESNRRLASKLREAQEAKRIAENKARYQADEPTRSLFDRLFNGSVRVAKDRRS